MTDIEKIKTLIESGNKADFDLAFCLLEGMGISEEEFILENYPFAKDYSELYGKVA